MKEMASSGLHASQPGIARWPGKSQARAAIARGSKTCVRKVMLPDA